MSDKRKYNPNFLKELTNEPTKPYRDNTNKPLPGIKEDPSERKEDDEYKKNPKP